ncbi:hypothetical protein Bca4012_065458 [Brassica carinata]
MRGLMRASRKHCAGMDGRTEHPDARSALHGTSTPRGNRQSVRDPERATLNARDGSTARVWTDGRSRGVRGCIRAGHVHHAGCQPYGYQTDARARPRGSLSLPTRPAHNPRLNLQHDPRPNPIHAQLTQVDFMVDGSSNVRGAGVGIVLTSPMGNTASRAVRCNFKATNKESAYEALIAGLTLAQQMGAENIQVYSDSQLIINQVQGEYQAKDDIMIQYLAVIQRLIKKFKSCILTQIPRE